ncbi:hypothetical protein Ctob_014808 [Chrysochromulina tobinii]|uniref:Flagellar associated protein n=1 Tax=Chrysochromulina tobinii TaxID=1460289 RepID=A0A0M0K9J4_9EUKA|nr:hypothetical protein Ctob_014808 [Chrysochromulina tobinii]|eukprot:KOO35521.1 hypothetical protein Ctob_014808 [Chrysochromulina sp. CCMP291]
MHKPSTRNMLPQEFGFSPGTSLIGGFGTTAARLGRPDYAPEPYTPGPGAYHTARSTIQTRTNRRVDDLKMNRTGWGSDKGHVLQLAAGGLNPGPGTYGEEQHPMGDILTEMRRSWPGVNSMSGFGTNASLPTLSKASKSNEPGPGQYDVLNASHFVTRTRGGQLDPYQGAARAATGSRRTRDTDSKRYASFASTRPAHKLPASGNSEAAIDAPTDFPAPNAYLPTYYMMATKQARTKLSVAMRHEGASGVCFDTSAKKFMPMADACVPDPANPGPGAHTIPRFNGERPSMRRPQPTTPATGFLVRAQRFGGGGGSGAHAATDPDAVLAFLAYGPMGSAGRPVHAQQAGAIIASRAAARSAV